MKRINVLWVLLILTCSTWGQARYIFYLIGDGMGCNQVLSTEMYLAAMQGRIGTEPLCMTGFPVAGLAKTYSKSNGITDSAAAGTCLASGEKTSNGRLGTLPDGKDVSSIAERLHHEGWAVGITTSVAIDHATPGAFYAHVANRDEYYTIGTHLAKSGFEFFGGAGFHQPENKSEWKRLNLYEMCEKYGYKIAYGAEEASSMMKAEKMILVEEAQRNNPTQKGESIPYAIDHRKNDLTLPVIAKTAVEYLSQYDRFFLMIEGGKIDYAGHANDAATLVSEVIDFDNAVKVAYEFYLKHPDETLIVVTADHETGGMALGNSDYTLQLQMLENQRISLSELNHQIKVLYDTNGKKLKWEQVRTLLTKTMGFYDQIKLTQEEDAALKKAYKKLLKGKDNSIKTLYHDIQEIGGLASHILNKKAKIGWTTYSHSASAVPVFAVGVGAERFGGWMDNSEIAPTIFKLAAH